MSDRHTPHDEPDADAVFRYCDNLARGLASLLRNDLEATALRVQRALRVSEPRLPVMPPSLKATIWEDIVQATVTGTPVAPTSRAGRGRRSSGRP